MTCTCCLRGERHQFATFFLFFTMSAPATEPNPTLDRRNRVLRTATPCSAGSLEIRARGNGLLRAAADTRVAPVGLEPAAGSVKISYMPTHARARRAAAGQPPEAIVPRLHACMHGRQSMQHAREAEGSWHAAAQVRARWPCLAPRRTLAPSRRTHSMIPWPGGRAGHDSPPFFPPSGAGSARAAALRLARKRGGRQ